MQRFRLFASFGRVPLYCLASAAIGALAVTGVSAAASARPGPPASPAPAAASPAADSPAADSPAADSPAATTSTASQPVLPSWAIGPFNRYSDPQSMPYQGNPLISPHGDGWEAAATYNPGVVYSDGTYKMLYRGQATDGGASQIGYATSTDGVHFTEYSGNPVINDSVPHGSSGVEDPRLYQLNGTYYTFFTGYSGGQIDIDKAYSTDMVHWTQVGPVEENDKDAAVVASPQGVPVKINGQYVMYYGQGGNGTYIAYSTDLLHWSAGTPVNLDLPSGYSPYEMCVAVTDYQTVAGAPANQDIDMFFAGTLMANGRWYYAISELEFSRSDLTAELDQLTVPVLQPETSYELLGQTERTVFMNDIIFVDGQWRMYYGAGDTDVALATAPLRSQASERAYDDFTGTSLEDGQRQPDWADEVDTSPGGGGDSGVGGLPGFGLSGPQASTRQQVPAHSGDTSLMYSGGADGDAQDDAYMKIFDLSGDPLKVAKNTTLSYWIYPQSSAHQQGVTGDNSSCVAVDLVFSDGTALRDLNVTDDQGSTLTPQGQCGHLTLDSWNHVSADIGAAASGKSVVRIDIGYDQPGSSGGYRGYIDDIALSRP
ncbi:MAG TPA: hypothetical protein VK817_21460 [Trebonia sp.]|nr:hypothetical protein [Trebonia sp.]